MTLRLFNGFHSLLALVNLAENLIFFRVKNNIRKEPLIIVVFVHFLWRFFRIGSVPRAQHQSPPTKSRARSWCMHNRPVNNLNPGSFN